MSAAERKSKRRKKDQTERMSLEKLEKEALLTIERLEKPKSTTVITLRGFLQRREANEIIRAVNSLQEESFVKVIFDMTDVKYANSSAIGAFVNCASSLKAGGGQAILLAMPQNIRKVFQTLGLAGLFTIVSTKDEALRAFS